MKARNPSTPPRAIGRKPGVRVLLPALLAPLLVTLGGCASGPNRNTADPLEPLNRSTWRFNEAIDRNFARPVARGYTRVVPRPIRTGVENFFSNLGDFPVMFNDFAQLRIMDGMNDLMRIAVNTSFGLLGVLDIATPAGIPKRDQDFGLTLGHYGVPSGPYLVLPLFGPSTFRDAAGFGVDQFAEPVSYTDPAWRNSLWGLNFVSTRARYLNATNLLEQAALDRYLFVRDAYLGRRRSQLDEGKEAPLPDYGKEK
ncbi:VacJ family lipoprotein [Massilia norwichensis]|uniref:VacJ family lipoprotein n=1 Tax=Massilia norwichensis TaxID=1442366 RepID=A0ABT2A079_9BURK|nr:VacJ family lipoprotein [Massilia norwichensis]MCS0587594.1 VacJ family lipoprotein [Massilia norwichensis]